MVADHMMNSGNRNKLWCETAWTFVIPDGSGPSFGFGGCCDVCTFCRKGLNSLLQTAHELKVRYKLLIILDLREVSFHDFVSIFAILCGKILKINPVFNTLSSKKLCLRLRHMNIKFLPLTS